MSSPILSKEGKEFHLLPVIKYENLRLPVMEIDREAVKNLPLGTNPFGLMVALLDQVGAQNNILWSGMHALAKDVYSRDEMVDVNGEARNLPKKFQEFAESVGLRLTDSDGNVLDIGEDLKN
jgi:hypothetical protein